MSYLVKENIQSIQKLPLVLSKKMKEYNNKNSLAKYTIEGVVNPKNLHLAWYEVVNNTPILRSIYKEVQNKNVQVILKKIPDTFQFIDIKEKSHEEVLKYIDEKVDESQNKQILIDEGPPALLTLIQYSKEKFVLLFETNPIFLDEISIETVLNDLFITYENINQGRNQNIPKRETYEKYNEYVGDQDWSNARDFWKAHNNENNYTSLSLQRPVKDIIIEKKDSISQILNVQLKANLLRNIDKNNQNSIFYSAWSLLLSIYSGEDNIKYQAVINGRPSTIKNSIGAFSQEVPLNSKLVGHKKINEVIKEHTALLDNIKEYSYVPFNEIQEENSPIQSSVWVNNLRKDLYKSKDFKVILDKMTKSIESPLLIEVNLDNLEICIGYSPVTFKRDTIKQIMKHYMRLIDMLIQEPEIKVKDINVLSQEELNKQIILFNSNTSGRKLDKLAHQIIEVQAENSPDSIAINQNNNKITYSDLNKKANQLAHWLRENGIGQNDLIGIFGNRGIEMVVSILGILKAGAAYVPIDPSSPDSRIKIILNEANMKMILTQNNILNRTIDIIRDLRVKPILFDMSKQSSTEYMSWNKLSDYPNTNIEPINMPSDLANIFFTSGSTGVPKGAMVEHRGMLNHLWAKIDLLGLNQNSIISQNASHCFDISVWQFLAPLMVGGQLHIYENEIANDPTKLLQSIKRDEITDLELVPTMMEMIMNIQSTYNNDEKELPNLKNLISTGEALSVDVCRKWLNTYNNLKVINAYGATECSDDTNHEVISTIPDQETSYIPIGRVIPNINAYIVDKYMRPVPFGCVGELCFSGIGVGRGYINNSEQTQKAFIPNPFKHYDQYETLYRSGDLGRYLNNGSIEFLGRLDHQIKVRGHRIELGEIESILLKHNKVDKCILVSHVNEDNQNSIVAYMTTNEELDISDVKSYLRNHLLESMIPEHLVILDEFPLNSNGKIDRKKLPSYLGKDSKKDIIEPRNIYEKTLCNIWSDVLNKKVISIDDNFFDLGGNSLKTVQVKTRIKQLLKIDINLDVMFNLTILKDLAEHLSTISNQELDLTKSIKPVGEQNCYVLSNSQKRIWFLQQINPNDTSYNTYGSYEIKGKINIENLVKSYKYLVNRHAGLRTVFKLIGNEPKQMIIEDFVLDIPIIDLTHLSEEEKSFKIENILKNNSNYVFDLEKGPLIKGQIIKKDFETYILLVSMHHIITDGWSWEIWENELFGFYKTFESNDIHNIGNLEFRYVDYAAWQNNYLTSNNFEKDEAFWLDRMSGELPIIDLPTDYSRPPEQTFDGKSKSITIDKDILDKLRSLCVETDTTLYMHSIAAISILFSRLSNQRDIIIGSPVAGREEVELENIIGLFVNTLPIRIHLDGNPSYKDFVSQVKENLVEFYKHQNYPFDMLVEKLNPIRDLSRTPIFSVISQLIHIDDTITTEQDYTLKNISFNRNKITYDLDISFNAYKDHLDINFHYNVSLFKEETIEQMLRNLVELLRNVANNSESTIFEIPIIDDIQTQKMNEWNNTSIEIDTSKSTFQLFESQAKKYPDKIAICFEEEHCTYSELNNRVSTLSNYLYQKGVKNGDLVGICASRSIRLIESILAILKVGAAFIPIDPSLPKDRQEYIINDSGIQYILTEGNLRDNFKEDIILLDIHYSDSNLDKLNNISDVNVIYNPSDLAYIIYTSGSTGKPKGVQISNGALLNFLLSMQAAPGMSSNDRLIAITNLSFDISLLEILLPLISGAQIELVSDEKIRDGELLQERINNFQPTIMQATPATWKLLINSGWKGNECLKKILCGGDILPKELAGQLLKRCNSIWNMYGPTEATIWATIKKINNVASVNIGKPISNYQTYILDEYMQQVPIGVKGELYISGLGLAKGYLNRPELNHISFINNPFDKLGIHNRLYKTGDIVRYLSNGDIEYIGRSDFQVKIRGYRIELGEIESSLLSIPGVTEAIVRARGHEDKELIAFLVLKKPIENDQIRQVLKEKLPVYMIPSHFVKVDKFPVTPNGKIDVIKLLEFDVIPENKSNYMQPRNRFELEMLEIWEDTLGVRPISVSDDFFAIGGHSLKAVELTNRIYNKFGIKLPLSTFFKYPKISELCEILKNKNKKFEDTSLIPIQQGKHAELPLYLIHPQGGGVLSYYHLSRALGEKYTVYGLQAVGHETNNKPLYSINEMAEHYLKEIFKVQLEGPYRIAGWSMGGTIAYEMAKKIEDQGGQVEFLGLIDTHSPTSISMRDKIANTSPVVQYAHLIGAQDEYDSNYTDEEGLRFLLNKAKISGYLPSDATVETMEQKVNLMNSGYVALLNYQPSKEVNSNIHLFKAMESNRLPLLDEHYWRDKTNGNLFVHEVEGHHDNIVEPPNVLTLAAVIKNCLEKKYTEINV
ncbi:amino acid adenylation domain-containing protein [Bacillus cereus BAG2X1-1]|nr:amino acid adenylation domain-containing protein [Bacillus cereus BAG2X1-1]